MVNIDFYHYTTKTGKGRIEESKIIKKSVANDNSRDTRYGEGVYGTKLSPEEGKRKIVENNWNVTHPTWKILKKGEWAIHVSIPEEEVVQANSDRDILIYPEDLHLDKYEWWIVRV